MAGPGKPGPPARGHEQVEYHLLQVQVIKLLDQGFSKSEMARELGYKDRGQAYRLIDRVMREDRVDAGVERIRVMQWHRMESIWKRLEPYVTGEPERDPVTGMLTPLDEKKMNTAIRLLEREAKFAGSDADTRRDDDDEDDTRAEGQRAALQNLIEGLDEFNTLAAEMYASGIGNGMSHEQQLALLTAASPPPSLDPNGIEPDDGMDGEDWDDGYGDDEIEAEILDIAMDWAAREDQKHPQAG